MKREYKYIFSLTSRQRRLPKRNAYENQPGQIERPVRVQLRRYLAEQWEFLDQHIGQMVKLGLLLPDSSASWQAPSHLVKKSTARLRMTIDLHLMYTATKADVWLVPSLETDLDNVTDCKHFATIDFCGACWKLPLDPSVDIACKIISPQGAFVTTRVIYGVKIATFYFQH